MSGRDDDVFELDGDAGDADRGVAPVNPAARRLQRRLAAAAVGVPALGVLAALGLHLGGYPAGAPAYVLFVVMFVATVLGVEVGFHRYFAHGAFKTKGWVRTLLAVLGSMALEGPVFFWAATHRRHHRYSDRPGDPHSPNLAASRWRGLWHAHVGWLFVAEVTDWARYAPDLVRDRKLFVVDRAYALWVALGLAIPTALGGLWSMSAMGALQGFLWGGLVRMFATHHVTWTVNSICHVFGDRPYEGRDRSTNNVWLALVSLGGSWHNNHHAYPTLARNDVLWWQIDMCGWFVRLLARAHLAWDLKVPTAKMIAAMRVKRGRP